MEDIDDNFENTRLYIINPSDNWTFFDILAIVKKTFRLILE